MGYHKCTDYVTFVWQIFLKFIIIKFDILNFYTKYNNLSWIYHLLVLMMVLAEKTTHFIIRA